MWEPSTHHSESSSVTPLRHRFPLITHRTLWLSWDVSGVLTTPIREPRNRPQSGLSTTIFNSSCGRLTLTAVLSFACLPLSRDIENTNRKSHQHLPYQLPCLPIITLPYLYLSIVVIHKALSRPFDNYMMACAHACRSPTRCARGNLLRNRPLHQGCVLTPLTVQLLLRGGYERDIYAFQGLRRHLGRSGAP